MSDNIDFLFFEDEEDTVLLSDKRPVENKIIPAITDKWKIMLADDEPEVHRITKLVLSKFQFEGKGLEFICAYSGKEARGLIEAHPDTALILLDVVMEEDDAGLKLVKYIREELGNRLVRIVLRTGQPGQAPEERVIVDYDINDYKDKTELTSQKLFTELVASLRAYKDVTAIEKGRLGLRKILDSYNYIFETNTTKDFTSSILHEIADILNHNQNAVNENVSGFSVVRNNDDYFIVSAIGRYSKYVDKKASDVLSCEIVSQLNEALSSSSNIYYDDKLIVYIKSKTASESLIYVEDNKNINTLDRGMIEVFCTNISAVNESILNKSRYEAEKEQRYLTETLYELNQKLTSTFNMKEVIDRLITSLTQTISCDAIMLVQKDQGGYYVASASGKCSADQGSHLSAASYEYNALRMIEDTKRSLLISDVHNCIYLLKNGCCEDEMCSMMGIPVLHQNQILGAVIMWKAEMDGFKRNEKEIAETFVNQAVIALVNAKLYSEVVNKRASVKNLLNNAGQGFLSIGENLCIDDEYSFECERIFGRKLSGVRITELVFGKSEDADFWENVLRSIFREPDFTKREVMMSLLHKEIDVNGRAIELDYKMIQYEGMQKLMLILTDITHKKALECEIEQERKTLQMVVNVVKHHHDFINSVSGYRLFCNITMYEVIRSAKNIDQAMLELFRNIHTYKGTFSQLGIVNISERLHRFENELQGMRNSHNLLSRAELENMITKLEMVTWLNKDLDILCSILGEQFVYQDKIVTVQQSKLIDIEERIMQIDNHEQYIDLIKSIRQLRYKSFRELLSAYPDYVSLMAERLEKLIKPFEIEGGYFAVDTDKYSSLAKALVHVFRNAVDHGLEAHEERLSVGKEECGTIRCNVTLKENSILICIFDDGRGLDLDSIGRRAVEKGIIDESELEKISEDELKLLIFNDEFSTSNNVTELSGRGYGLAAIKHEVDMLGGSIEVQSHLGEGATFCFAVPYIE